MFDTLSTWYSKDIFPFPVGYLTEETNTWLIRALSVLKIALGRALTDMR